jgi:hypothetical protein
MKKYLPIIVTLCLVKLCIHLIGDQNYGFHRDELLHLSASEHLAWGYMEFPPFIAFIGKIAHTIFGYSLLGVRIFPTLAGVGILILCCMMAKEMGGKSKAVLLAGICVLGFVAFFRNHLLFQPVAFDQFFWTLGFYYVVRYFNTKQNKYLILLGIAFGLGMMNKYTILIWGLGIVIGLLFYDKGRLFKNKWLYIAALLSLLIVLPNLIWQYQHHFPILLHYQKLSTLQLDKISPYQFGLDQLKLPFTLAVSVIGLYALFFDKALKNYKVLGVAAIVIFVTMWILHSKSYYFFSAYPVLFAAGAVKLEQLFERKPFWNYVVAFIIIAPIIYFIPKAIPVLPIEKYVAYEHKKPGADGRIELTGDYADMFGWNEQVQLVDSVYRSLSAEEKGQCFIWTKNYGEAGAVEILGKKYGLPNPVCSHGSFWLWGAGTNSGQICIAVGKEKEVLEKYFKQVTLVRMITHKYAVEEENNIPVFICREPLMDIKQTWGERGKNVFD